MIVADASVVIAALVDDGASGEVARGRLVGESVAAPDLVYAEVTSALRGLERSSQLTPRRAAAALSDLLAMPLRVASHRGLLPRCWEIRYTVTSYDALYLALAEVTGAPLVTADRRLATAIEQRCAVELLVSDT